MMIFSVCRPQYFIAHTKSQRLLVTRHRLSCEKVNLHNTLVTWAWNTCGLTYSLRASSPLPLAASPVARAFSRDPFHSSKEESLLAGYLTYLKVAKLIDRVYRHDSEILRGVHLHLPYRYWPDIKSGVKICQTEQYTPLTIPRNTPADCSINNWLGPRRSLNKEIYKNSGGYLLTFAL